MGKFLRFFIPLVLVSIFLTGSYYHTNQDTGPSINSQAFATDTSLTNTTVISDNFNDNYLDSGWTIWNPSYFDTKNNVTIQENNQHIEIVENGTGSGYDYITLLKDIDPTNLTSIGIDFFYNTVYLGDFGFTGFNKDNYQSSWRVGLRDVYAAQTPGFSVETRDASQNVYMAKTLTPGDLPSYLGMLSIHVEFNGDIITFDISGSTSFHTVVDTSSYTKVIWNSINIGFGLDPTYAQSGFYIYADNYTETYVTKLGNLQSMTNTTSITTTQRFTESQTYTTNQTITQNITQNITQTNTQLENITLINTESSVVTKFDTTTNSITVTDTNTAPRPLPLSIYPFILGLCAIVILKQKVSKK